MTQRLSRRTFLAGLAAIGAARAAAVDAPAGSARYLVELIAFRQPGDPPQPAPVAPLPGVTPIPGRIEVLPESAWQLVAAEQALARAPGYEVLAHTAWAAIVPANGRTTARLEDVLREGTPLAGAIAVQRSQYLFLGVDVDYLPAPATTFGLREKRRVRFGERHYFDHPAFGVIALVTPSRGGVATD